MNTEIGNAKVLKLRDFKCNVSTYFGVTKEMNLRIDKKDDPA